MVATIIGMLLFFGVPISLALLWVFGIPRNETLIIHRAFTQSSGMNSGIHFLVTDKGIYHVSGGVKEVLCGSEYSSLPLPMYLAQRLEVKTCGWNFFTRYRTIYQFDVAGTMANIEIDRKLRERGIR